MLHEGIENFDDISHLFVVFIVAKFIDFFVKLSFELFPVFIIIRDMRNRCLTFAFDDVRYLVAHQLAIRQARSPYRSKNAMSSAVFSSQTFCETASSDIRTIGSVLDLRTLNQNSSSRNDAPSSAS